MIKLDLSLLFFIYLVLSLGGIILLWLWFEIVHPPSKLAPYSKKMYRCSICAYKYVDDEDKPITKCPRCQSLNDPKTSMTQY